MMPADTGFFFGQLNRRDALHPVVMRWLRVLDQPLLVTDPVLFELLNGLADTPLRKQAGELATAVQSVSGLYVFVPMSPPLREEGVRLYRDRPDKAWSLTDCVSFVVMRERGLTRALTHDHHFEQAGFEPLLRREPG